MAWKAVSVVGFILLVVAPWLVLLMVPPIVVGASVVVVTVRGVNLLRQCLQSRTATESNVVPASAPSVVDDMELEGRVSGVRVRAPIAAALTGPVALSPLESQVLTMTTAGASARAIEEELELAPGQIDGVFEALFAKLGVDSRVSLALLLDEGQAHFEIEASGAEGRRAAG